MYSHIIIKKNAKSFLQQNQGPAIVVILLTVLAAFASIIPVIIFSPVLDTVPGYILSSVAEFAVAFIFVYPVTIGSAGWFLQTSRGCSAEPTSIFSVLKSDLKSMAVLGAIKSIYIFAWSFVFVIPGIIKNYAYSMAEYIKYDNPDLTFDQVLSLSDRITKGHKGDLFYLDLSFIGWFILGSMTCHILNIVYTVPYYYSARTFAYEALKQEAISKGIVSPDEFGINTYNK